MIPVKERRAPSISLMSQWLSRHRLLIVKLLILVCMPVVLVTHHGWQDDGWLDEVFDLSGYALIGLGVLGRVWASFYICGRKNCEIVTTGPYSICRNPLYLSTLLIALGMLSIMENLLVVIPVLLILVPAYSVTIRNEERYLSNKFGEPYEAYARRVPRLLPAFWKYRGGIDSTVSMHGLFLRGVLDAGWCLLFIPMAEAIEAMHIHGTLPVLMKVF